jgi:hypothetical protein
MGYTGGRAPELSLVGATLEQRFDTGTFRRCDHR